MTVTNPIIRLMIGVETLEFSNEDVLSANLVEETNIIATELPISTLEVKVLCYDESFSMFSGEYFDLLSERLPIMAYESVDGIQKFLGKFYLSEWVNISENEFEFSAIDIIGVLNATDYDGNFWETNTSLSKVLSDTLDSIDVLYELDSSLVDIPVRGWIPPGTYREALQQICLATGAMAISVRNEKLQIVPAVLPTKMFDYKLRATEKLSSQSVELQSLVTSIEIVSHNYSRGDELEEIFCEELDAGLHKIIFEKPYYDIVIDGPGYTPSLLITEAGDFIVTETGDYIEVGGEYEFGPNCLYLNLIEGGTVTITGYPWLDSKRSFIFRETGVTEYANKNALKIEDATLINLDNAQDILVRITEYYRLRYKQNITLLPSDVKIGDIVLTGTLYERKLLAAVQKMSTDLTGGYLAKTEIFGFEPEFVEPIANPIRVARTGFAYCGAELIRQNMFREYDHA